MQQLRRWRCAARAAAGAGARQVGAAALLVCLPGSSNRAVCSDGFAAGVLLHRCTAPVLAVCQCCFNLRAQHSALLQFSQISALHLPPSCRSVLASYLAGTPHPRTLLFGRNAHGKPHLLWPTATPGGHTLRFNLTHTASLIGLAVTGGQAPGGQAGSMRAGDGWQVSRLSRTSPWCGSV